MREKSPRDRGACTVGGAEPGSEGPCAAPRVFSGEAGAADAAGSGRSLDTTLLKYHLRNASAVAAITTGSLLLTNARTVFSSNLDGSRAETCSLAILKALSVRLPAAGPGQSGLPAEARGMNPTLSIGLVAPCP